MVQQTGVGKGVHVELLCGGRPSFEFASEIKRVVIDQGHTCNIIHLDRAEEESVYGSEDDFIPLRWNEYVVEQTTRNKEIIELFGQQRINEVISRFPANQVPFDHPLGVRLAAYSARDQIKDQLNRDLRKAKEDNRTPYVCICLVPEGPTGSGVARALMDWLPGWREDFIELFRRSGYVQPDFFHFFLLELVPATPDQGGDAGNILQGYMTRANLHEQPWPYHWFRFDGAKVDHDNKTATEIGSKVMGLLLTQRWQPGRATDASDQAPVGGSNGARNGEEAAGNIRQGARIELVEVLKKIDSENSKPVEVTVSAINLPADEDNCKVAGKILKDVEDKLPLPIPEAEHLAARWKHRPAIGNRLDAVKDTRSKDPRQFLLTILAIVAVIFVAAVVIFGVVYVQESNRRERVQVNLITLLNTLQQNPDDLPAPTSDLPALLSVLNQNPDQLSPGLSALRGQMQQLQRQSRLPRSQADLNSQIANLVPDFLGIITGVIVLAVVGGVAVLSALFTLGFFYYFVRRDIEFHRELKATEVALLQQIEKDLDEEMSSDLKGPSNTTQFGDWYVKYHFTHGNPGFKSFLDDKKILCQIIEQEDLRTSEIKEHLRQSVQARILAGDWLPPRRGGSTPNTNAYDELSGRRNALLIPISTHENLEVFGLKQGELQIDGVNTQVQSNAGSRFELSCMYIVMRSPVSPNHLANRKLYEDEYEKSSREDRIARELGPAQRNTDL